MRARVVDRPRLHVRRFPPHRFERRMPYLHLDLPGRFPAERKRELATRLCRLYADVMQTQTWRPNVGIAELGEDNLFHLGPDGLGADRDGAGRIPCGTT